MGDNMKEKILGIMAVLFLLLSLSQLGCEKDIPRMEWTFEPHTDRSVHVKAVCDVGAGRESYGFTGISREYWIKNLTAYEYGSRKSISHEIQYDSVTDTQTIELTFKDPTPEGFRCAIEFDLSDFLEEEEEKTFIFEFIFGTDEEESHTAVVYLPKDAELLEVEHLIPVRVENEQQVTIHYQGKSGPSADFEFLLVFSSSGKNYVSLAERYEQSGQYDQAISYYQKAKSFYNRFDLYGKDKADLLGEFQERIFVMQRIQADDTYEEALEAFNQGEYEKAKSDFETAEYLYRILKDTEREAECREMITECEKMEELRKEAEDLFEQGKTQYEAEQYEEAKESFTQAQTKFEGLEDAERIAACKEWIAKCEEAGLGIGLCVLGILVILLLRKYS